MSSPTAKKPDRLAGGRPAAADSRTRQRRGEDRRNQIVSEAVHMLAARGFRGISVSDLANEVGMTAPGLLYYFGDKDGLLRAVVEERQRIEFGEFFEDTPDDDLSIRVLPDMARANTEAPELVRLYQVLAMENLDAGDPLHDFFVERYERARRLARKSLARDVERGVLRDDLDTTQVAGEIIATLIGFEVQWLMDPERFDYAGSMTAYIDGLLQRYRPDISNDAKISS